MIFQVLATLMLSLVLATALARRFDMPLLKVSIIGAAIVGLHFVWRPEQLTLIAHRIGVGRGADLVTYGSSLLFFLSIVAVALRRRTGEQQLTHLVREIANLHARPPQDRRGSDQATE